jgi:hypothetical protein
MILLISCIIHTLQVDSPSIGHKLILERNDKKIVFKIFDIHHNINGEGEIQVMQMDKNSFN